MLKEDSPLIIMLEECTPLERAEKIDNIDIPLAICRDCPNAEWFTQSRFLYCRCKSSQQISFATARDDNEKSVCVEDCDTYLMLFKEKHDRELTLDEIRARNKELKKTQSQIDAYKRHVGEKAKEKFHVESIQHFREKYLRRNANGLLEAYTGAEWVQATDAIIKTVEERIKKEAEYLVSQRTWY